MYNFNLRNIIAYLLPIALRANSIDLLQALCSPVSSLHSQFKIFRTRKLKELSYNSQYPNFQRLLNDQFDKIHRRIKVFDGEHINGLIIFSKAEEIAVISPVLVRPQAEYITAPFIVELPLSFESNNNKLNQIKRIVDTYKFAGVKHKIIFNYE